MIVEQALQVFVFPERVELFLTLTVFLTLLLRDALAIEPAAQHISAHTLALRGASDEQHGQHQGESNHRRGVTGCFPIGPARRPSIQVARAGGTVNPSSTTIATATAIATLFALAGCGPNCQSSCNKLFEETECGIQIPGSSADQSRDACEDMCEDALLVTGSLGSYVPQNGGGIPERLLNETQAAAWMDCIDETECSELGIGNICEPFVPGSGG